VDETDAVPFDETLWADQISTTRIRDQNNRSSASATYIR
jgi:hypothetical protein